MKVTVVGARGFIGRAVAAHARAAAYDVLEVRHDDVPADVSLGVVVYCSGVASGADRRPLEAYEQHVGALLNLVRAAQYERLVYVSSTRVYDRAQGTVETDATAVVSESSADTYVLSKLAGEGVALAASPENRVVRLSNVYGPSVRSELFLSDVLRQAIGTGRIAIRSSLDSSKDYVSVEDAAACILRIALNSRERTYNVAAGRNTTHRELIQAISQAITVTTDVAVGAPTNLTREIDVGRIQAEHPFRPRDVVADLPAVIAEFRAAL